LTDEQAQLPIKPDHVTGSGLDAPTYNWCDREDDGGDSLRVARTQQAWEEPVDTAEPHAVWGLSTEIVLYESGSDGAQQFLDAFADVATCPPESNDIGTTTFSEALVPPGLPDGSFTVHLEKSFTDGTESLNYLYTAVPVGDLVGILYVYAQDLVNAGIAAADLAPILADNLEAANSTLND